MQTKVGTIQSLVGRIESGESSAETELVERYGNGVRLILLKRTGNSHLAKDLSQDTFVVALRRLRAGELKNPGSLAAFIRQTAINISIEHFRKEKRYVHQPDEIISLHVSHRDHKDKMLDSESSRQLLEGALERLSVPRDREVLRRFYLLDEDKDRICSDLDLSKTHFDRVLYRARKRMRSLIIEEKGLKALLFGGLVDG